MNEGRLDYDKLLRLSTSILNKNIDKFIFIIYFYEVKVNEIINTSVRIFIYHRPYHLSSTINPPQITQIYEL